MKLLVITGRKQSGKTTLANFITAYKLNKFNPDFDFDLDGNLLLKQDYVDVDKSVKSGYGIVDLARQDQEFIQFAQANIWPYVKTFSYADSLKQFCIRHFGLTYEQCYGSDEDKNSLTKLRWEDMPGFADPFNISTLLCEAGSYGNPEDIKHYLPNLFIHEKGIMSARQVLQFFGTEIGRKMYDNCWIDGTFNEIVESGSELSILIDGRFPNEITRTKELAEQAGIEFMSCRLSRKPYEDNHASEIQMDSWTPDQFDIYIEDVELMEKNRVVLESLLKKGWL